MTGPYRWCVALHPPDERSEPASPADDPLGSRLLAAATAEFAERGYAGARVAEIARRAGVTTGAIYSPRGRSWHGRGLQPQVQSACDAATLERSRALSPSARLLHDAPLRAAHHVLAHGRATAAETPPATAPAWHPKTPTADDTDE